MVYLHVFIIKLFGFFWSSFCFILPLSYPPSPPPFGVPPVVTLCLLLSPLSTSPSLTPQHPYMREDKLMYCRYVCLTLMVKYGLLDLLWMTVLLVAMSWDNSETRAWLWLTLPFCFFFSACHSQSVLPVSLPKIPTALASYHLNNMLLLPAPSLILNKLWISYICRKIGLPGYKLSFSRHG